MFISYFSFVKCLFKVFVHFLIWLPNFILSISRCYTYIYYRNMSVVKYPLPFSGLIFHLLMFSFAEKKFLFLIKFNLLHCFLFKKSLPTWKWRRHSLSCFLPGESLLNLLYIRMFCTFNSFMCMVWGKGQSSFCFLPTGLPIENDHSFPPHRTWAKQWS